jgi:hypothetical protein
MLREFTVTVEDDVYEAIRPMVESKTIGDFLSRVVWQSPAYLSNCDPMALPVEERRRRADAELWNRRQVDPKRQEEANRKLCGCLGYTDGHEVDRFLERCHADKIREAEIEAHRRGERA